jgi:peptidoglycan hydrolase-like protein with peptidoglycan-binding domain
MRFTEFRIIKEAAENIAVIGDSIAVGIKSAGGASAGKAVGGSNTKQVLGFVTDFVQSGKANGATVILSSGAANSANVSTVDGKKFQSENLGPVAAQIKQLKDAGAKVVLVGVASGKTPPQKPTQYTNGKQWIIDYSGMNDQLESIATSNGATFLGPLEEFDPGISRGDGIHPFNGYGKLFKAGSAGAGTNLGPAGATPGKPATKDKQGAGTKPTEVLSVPTGRRGPEVADVQKALLALGYQLPRHGVDGIRGPETVAAVKEFQQANGLTIDGDPGPETIAVLNKVIASKGIKIEKSTAADVKVLPGSGRQVSGKLPPLKMDSATEGKVGELLNFIARYESNGDYNIMVGGKRGRLTDMTVAEILDMQKSMRARGHESTAVGRYQYIRSTLIDTAAQMSMDVNSTKFDEKTQDALAIQTLRTIGLEKWLDGKLDDGAFLNKVAQVWASIPKTSGGSAHAGVGSNKAGVNADVALNTLQDIRTA